MQKIIKLRNPIQINGKIVSEIAVDPEEITTALYAEADYRKRIAAGTKTAAFVPVYELDFGLYPYIGFAAAIAVNPEYSFEDLERVHGGDVMAFTEVGRNFLLQSEDAQSSSSGESSETTPEPSTQASQTLSESE